MLPALANIDIRLLRVFAAIVEAGGFAAAQAQLNVSASRISTQVADLEARLGMRLCQRGRVGFRLTDKGRAVHEASQRLFAAIEQFRAQAGALSGRIVGELQIGVVDNTLTNPESRLAAAIGRFKARENDVHITLHILAPTDLERAVLDGRIQVAIGAFHHHVAGLLYEPLFAEEQTLYCGRAHPLFSRADGRLALADVTAADFADRGYMGGVEARRPAVEFKVAATAYHMEALAILILSGHYIGYLPTHYAAPSVACGLIRSLLPQKLAYQSLFEVIVRRGAEPTMAVRAFLDDLQDVHRDVSRRAAAAEASPVTAVRRRRAPARVSPTAAGFSRRSAAR